MITEILYRPVITFIIESLKTINNRSGSYCCRYKSLCETEEPKEDGVYVVSVLLNSLTA